MNKQDKQELKQRLNKFSTAVYDALETLRNEAQEINIETFGNDFNELPPEISTFLGVVYGELLEALVAVTRAGSALSSVTDPGVAGFNVAQFDGDTVGFPFRWDEDDDEPDAGEETPDGDDSPAGPFTDHLNTLGVDLSNFE